ncbi:hypothetical protein NDU88_006146 [Pleurodeles waltl]|uniref:Uncharacterized protein n=1 Tax=Pleurodeles waltl TaxID=8319 RepID=A0AAV7MF10_PLEWA|nr:hypothetical protein NDU88_006146 [Pleurodeles waltl]
MNSLNYLARNGKNTGALKMQHIPLKIKASWKLRAAEDSSILYSCWQEVEAQQFSNVKETWGSYLNHVIISLGMEGVWKRNIGKAAYNRLVNITVCSLSLITDKAILDKRRHAWAVLGSYSTLSLQEYLADHFSVHHKHQFLLYRMGFFDTIVLPGKASISTKTAAYAAIIKNLCRMPFVFVPL